MNQDLIIYLQQQIRTGADRLQRYTQDVTGNIYPSRLLYKRLDNYIQNFIAKKSANSLVIMPGFRGVGKTTLMAQLCAYYQSRVKHVLFLSIEEIRSLFNVGITETLVAYEFVIGYELTTVKEPVLLFFDEVQSDPEWALALKIMYDRTNKVFCCCSGSSALLLNTTPSLARRAVIEKIPPLNFIEYAMIKHDVACPEGLSVDIRQGMYHSLTARETFFALQKLQSRVSQYWSQVSRNEIIRYLSYGTLPFAFTMPNEVAVYDAISLLLDKIIQQDLSLIGNFDNNTLAVIKRIIFALAEQDTTSINQLENKFQLHRITISMILDALVSAELLIDVPPYGSNMTVARKAHKYLFMSPAVRMTFFYITGQASTFQTRQGKLLEDSVGGHIYREFILSGYGALRYDSSKGGVDFILQIGNSKQLLIEVGKGGKTARQINNSQKRIASDYNLIISNNWLRLDEDSRTVFIPLDYYFLL